MNKSLKQSMRMVHSMTGNARVIGITGAPGSGESTLTDRLARELFSKGFKIGIIAVDPSSPFSGGALLGGPLAYERSQRFARCIHPFHGHPRSFRRIKSKVLEWKNLMR